MLPHDNLVLLQIGNDVVVDLAALVVFQHPADMGEPETAANGVRILVVIIHVAVMHAVAGAPHQDGVLQGHAAENGQEPLQRRAGLVGAMGPQAVVAAANTDSGEDHEQGKKAPGPAGKTDREPVPGHEDHGSEEGQAKGQGNRPVARAFRAFRIWGIDLS